MGVHFVSVGEYILKCSLLFAEMLAKVKGDSLSLWMRVLNTRHALLRDHVLNCVLNVE